jgi:DNA-binding CsgD family transcriptional regulator
MLYSKKPTLDSVIARLYESVLDPNCLQEALGFCGLYAGASDALIMSFDKKTELPINAVLAGLSQSFDCIDDYVNHYGTIDPRTYINKASIKEWRCCHKINNQHFVNHNEFYQDYLLPLDARYLMVTRAYEDDEQYTLHGLVGSVSQGAFDLTNILAANRFFDHLQRTLRLNKQTQQLQTKIDLGAIAIDHLELSMILVNERNVILHLNTSADKLLNDPNVDLICHNGFLTTQLSSHHYQLKVLIGNAIKKGEGGQMNFPRSNDYQVFVTPVSASLTLAKNWQTPLALVLIKTTEMKPSQLQWIAKFYKLTPAEAGLAGSLITGQSLEEYAIEKKVTLNTVRTQLKSLFQKTNTKRQAQLVATLNIAHPFF